MTFRTHVYADASWAPEQPALLLLSGGPGASSHLWEPIDELRARFPVVTVDVPGSAGLPETESLPYRFGDVVLGIEKAVTALPFRRYAVAGFSFGGLFAAALALRGKVSVCAWAGIASPMTPRAFALSEAHFRPRLSPEMRAAEAAVVAAPSSGTFRALLRTLVPLYFLPENQAAGDRFLAAENPSGRLFLDVYGEMLRGEIPNLAAGLCRLALPKLMIAGLADGMIPLEALRQDAEEIGAELVCLPASHFVNFERPKLVADAFARGLLEETDEHFGGLDARHRQRAFVFHGSPVPGA